MKKAAAVLIGIVSLLLLGLVAVQTYANKKAEENLKTLLSDLGIRDFSYGKVQYSLLSGRIEVEDLLIRGKEGKTRVDRFVVSKLTDTDLEFWALGIKGEDEEFKRLESELRELGYDKASLNLYISASLYEDTGDLFVRRVSLELPGALSLDMSLRMSGVDRKLLEDIKSLEDDDREKLAQVANRLASVYLKEITLQIKDAGLLRRLIDREAKKRGKSAEGIKNELIEKIKTSFGKNSHGFERSLAEGLSALIESGGTLVLEGKPEKPVSFDDLVLYTLIGIQSRDFSPVAEELGIKIKHEPP